MSEINNICPLKNIKSKYIMKKIFQNLQEIRFLNFIRYNINIKNRIDITLDDYKKCTNIEIKIDNIGVRNFINRIKYDKYIHIYFNDEKKEIKEKTKEYIGYKEKVENIKIIIEYGIKSLEGLFQNCGAIKKINFIRFSTRGITNMSKMFYNCPDLEELDLSNFKTENVTDMNSMFSSCSKLKKINLSNIDTINVVNMSNMFSECKSLKEVNFNNFKNIKVKNMVLILLM